MCSKTTEKPLILQVAVPTPLRKTFDYLAPNDGVPVIGARVTVPFGKRQCVGVVLGTSHESAFALNKLKPIENVIDEVPLFDQHLLSLVRFAAQYYHHPIGDVFSHCLPGPLRLGKMPRQKTWAAPTCARDVPPILTEEQHKALTHITEHRDTFHVSLLHGITGSGKTEVYLQAMAPVLAAGQQVLILVPEIGLTPQIVSRVEARFGLPVAVLHSGLADGARAQAWLAAQRNEIQIIIATRSGVFVPAPTLGLIIIDEEHDLSFKQQEGFRYHARDLAVWRAKALGIPVILGSATPSFESMKQADIGRYTTLSLTERAQGLKTPLRLIDLRNERMEANISPVLLEAIAKRLERKEQVLLFLNRRGFAPTWMCHGCGWIATCPRCDAHLTYHQDKRLICHHCDHQVKTLMRCKECGSPSYVLLGQGTQRIEEYLTKCFPHARIARVDRDSTRKKNALTDVLDQVHAGEIDILLGTQMLAKGHHFPKVTLVAILDADSGLLSSDFRAPERLAQLLTQVSGRAGREHLPGEVFVQTHHPDHPLLMEWLQGGYTHFAKKAMIERSQLSLPPFGHMTLLRAESPKQDAPMAFLMEVKQWLNAHAKDLSVLGPIPALMEKRQGKFRAQLLLQATQRQHLHECLHHLMHAIENHLSSRSVRFSWDVDPQEM
ncbi:MAG: primosomal protein N' [Gammaproteobacteria bacterium]